MEGYHSNSNFTSLHQNICTVCDEHSSMSHRPSRFHWWPTLMLFQTIQLSQWSRVGEKQLNRLTEDTLNVCSKSKPALLYFYCPVSMYMNYDWSPAEYYRWNTVANGLPVWEVCGHCNRFWCLFCNHHGKHTIFLSCHILVFTWSPPSAYVYPPPSLPLIVKSPSLFFPLLPPSSSFRSSPSPPYHYPTLLIVSSVHIVSLLPLHYDYILMFYFAHNS